MYSFLPSENSVSSELLENLHVEEFCIPEEELTQSKNVAVPFNSKMKLGSLSIKRSALGEILLYVTAVDYRDREEFKG